VKKIILLIGLALVVFAVTYRQRIYVWDPLATVSRDGMKQSGVRVTINYSNDVLVDDGSTGKHTIYLVQNWNKVAEYPTRPLHCIEYLACMTDADQAAGDKVTPGSRGKREPFEGVTMTNRRVEFVDEGGNLVAVVLR